MYEVNIRAFSSTGTFQGVIDRLDSIKALGINTIWLMPIYPIGVKNSVNSPYCIKNYTEINPEFGLLDDFKTLVSEAHEKNMAVIIDWVANHTAWDNPWITNKSWYTQDEDGIIIYPAGTNWQDVADLNYSNQDMRKEMIKSMKYWIETADIDGFRCDAADYVPYNFWAQAIDSLYTIGKYLILLSEGSRNDHFTAGFQMNYGWDFYYNLVNVFNDDYSVTTIYNTHNTEYKNIPEGKHKLRFTTNHDESAWNETPVILFNGKKGALAA
ncbi:MAG: alpha-amylase family glycosyl hydrolase, partial [Candidatus Neomarinimicrobiota bacterium]